MDLLSSPSVELSNQSLMCFYRNHLDARYKYVLSYVDILMVSYNSNQPNRCHANDFQRSSELTLKGFTRNFHRSRKQTFLHGTYPCRGRNELEACLYFLET